MKNSIRLAALVALSLALPAAAEDGRLEINQSCAISGCLPGDSSFYPITIGAGSYVLTGPLTPPSNTTAIELTGGNVTIDLNGFTIDGGSGGCTGSGTSISCPVGTGIGIDAAGATNVRIENGIVKNFHGDCLELDFEAVVSELAVTGCSGDGIEVADDSAVRESIVTTNGGNGILGVSQLEAYGNISHGNGGHGIRATGNLHATENITTGNGDFGISSNNQALIRANIAVENNDGGIDTNDRSRIETNVASANPSGPGIFALNDTVIESNSASENGGTTSAHGIECRFRCNVTGNAAASNGLDGIHVGGSGSINFNATGANGNDGIECDALSANSCHILGNTSVDNVAGYGLRLSAAGSVIGVYKANTFENNGAGDVSAAGLDPPPGLQNTCSGTIPCP